MPSSVWFDIPILVGQGISEPREASPFTYITYTTSGAAVEIGNGYLRGLLVQAAWVAVRSKNGGALRERYLYNTAKKGVSKKKTVVATGRRMADLMYSVL